MTNESTYEYAAELNKTDGANYDEDDDNNLDNLKKQITSLAIDNEQYQQDLHSLQCKLNVEHKIQNELQESNDNLEQIVKKHQDVMKQKIHEIEEKHAAEKQDLFARLSDLETESTKKSKTIEELKLNLKKSYEKIEELSVAECESTVIDDSSLLQQQLQILTDQLSQKDAICKELEEFNKYSSNEISELREILDSTKIQLLEKNTLLETIKDEFAECKIELESIKNVPANANCKGNSLFAEVEDRRQKMLDNMTSMKTKYYEAKKIVDDKNREIKSLKAELAAVLRKFEDDTVETLQQNINLSDKYKNRITELEIKLKNKLKIIKNLEEQKMIPINDAFSFFQSLVESKKRDIESLEKQLENVSINAVLEEEMKHKMGRQLRYWRCKAMSNEAQLVSIKMYLESNSDPKNNEIQKILKESLTKNSKLEETLDVTHETPSVINESEYALDKLLPKKLNLTQTIKDYSMIDNKNYNTDNDDNKNSSIEQTIVMNETIEETILAPSTINIQNCPSIIVKPSISIPNQTNLQNKNIPSSIKTTTEKQDKKILRFSDDTVDPEPKILKRQQSTPKYPIIFVSSKSKKPL